MVEEDFWVFGYGSLMWNPGFEYEESHPARLLGYHRALCIYSWVHRGTEDQPGLVLGLDRGGSCHGIGFRIKGTNRQSVISYLDEREMMNNVYRPTWGAVQLNDPTKTRIAAYTFVANPANAQYAGGLSADEIQKLVAQGCGRSGTCHDYIANTLQQLHKMGVQDRKLEAALTPKG